MAYKTTNPMNGTTTENFADWNGAQIQQGVTLVSEASQAWRNVPIEQRCAYLRKVAQVLREQRDTLAPLITLEMGKLIKEARAEIEKCAWACDYYADFGPGFLSDEIIETDASKSLVAYQPLGVVLAVMPWNFPFWQVFRFAAPSLIAGNAAILKHASNVPQCALAIEKVFLDAGMPEHVFRTFLMSSKDVATLIKDARVHAVTLTGSGPAGKSVAATAAGVVKKSVLELGGSDPFVVLEDANLKHALKQALLARFLNMGQSCIAGKRFIVVDAIADEFVQGFKQLVEGLLPGDPMDEATTLAPMARHDLRDELHKQVLDSMAKGAKAITGCSPEDSEGAFYQPSILDHVGPGMRAYAEEFFGPVAIVIRARDEQDAIRIANDTPFGLGGSVWTQDQVRGERIARQLQCGAVFVNGMVKSDPRLPFGGIKESGYGRELGSHGIREFVNAKTIWIR